MSLPIVMNMNCNHMFACVPESGPGTLCVDHPSPVHPLCGADLGVDRGERLLCPGCPNPAGDRPGVPLSEDGPAQVGLKHAHGLDWTHTPTCTHRLNDDTLHAVRSNLCTQKNTSFHRSCGLPCVIAEHEFSVTLVSLSDL